MKFIVTTAKAPPIKIQGIKTKLVPFIADHVDWDGRGRWIEPFLGSGAVLFNLQPQRALVSDTCAPLIDFYQGIQQGRITPVSVEVFLRAEGDLLRREGEAHYYRVRERFNDSGDPLDFLFLNRSCFNGLVRFNRGGGFNTPFCRKPERFRAAYVTRICNQVRWVSAVMAGKDWEFVATDWWDTLAQVDERDFIYADPPYPKRNADYYSAWSDADGDELVAALQAAPCRFLYSTWVENRFRSNDALSEWFSGCPVVTYHHYYHVGASESLRHPMLEGLVIG